MLRITEKLDDVEEEWNILNITPHTFYDLCSYYVGTFYVHSKYENNKKVKLKLFNKDKLLLTFKLTKH